MRTKNQQRSFGGDKVRREWIIGLGKSRGFWRAVGNEGEIERCYVSFINPNSPSLCKLLCAQTGGRRCHGRKWEEGDMGKGREHLGEPGTR